MKFKPVLGNSLPTEKVAEVEIAYTFRTIEEGEKELREGKTKTGKTLANFLPKIRRFPTKSAAMQFINNSGFVFLFLLISTLF